MKAKYDDVQINLTGEFLYALELLMREEVAMMKAVEPKLADCWHWGRCTISDLSRRGGIEFEYGALEDTPEDGCGQFAVIVETIEQ